jgi:hypothetical protein
MKHLKSRLSNPQGNNTIVRDFPTMIKNLEELKKSFLIPFHLVDVEMTFNLNILLIFIINLTI